MIPNWGGVYLIQEFSVNQESSGLGFLLFSMGMLIGRFSMDYLSKFLEVRKMIFSFGILASVGFGLCYLDFYYISLLSFFLIGLGLSVIIPSLYKIISHSKNDGISLLAGTGSVAFFISPIIIGFISQEYSTGLVWKGSFILVFLITITFELFFDRKRKTLSY